MGGWGLCDLVQAFLDSLGALAYPARARYGLAAQTVLFMPSLKLLRHGFAC